MSLTPSSCINQELLLGALKNTENRQAFSNNWLLGKARSTKYFILINSLLIATEYQSELIPNSTIVLK